MQEALARSRSGSESDGDASSLRASISASQPALAQPPAGPSATETTGKYSFLSQNPACAPFVLLWSLVASTSPQASGKSIGIGSDRADASKTLQRRVPLSNAVR